MVRSVTDALWVGLRSLQLRLRHELEGATAVEYGLFVALIAAVIVGVVVVIGTATEQGFNTTCEGLNQADGIDCAVPN